MEDISLVEGGEDKVIKILVLVFGGQFDHGGDGGDGGDTKGGRMAFVRSLQRTVETGVVPR